MGLFDGECACRCDHIYAVLAAAVMLFIENLRVRFCLVKHGL